MIGCMSPVLTPLARSWLCINGSNRGETRYHPSQFKVYPRNFGSKGGGQVMPSRRSCWLLVAGVFATAIALAAAILASAAQAQPGAAPAGRPNFLLILSDDQRHDTMDY